MCANESTALRCNYEPDFGDAIGFFYDGPGALADFPVVVEGYSLTTSDLYPMRTMAKGYDLLLLFVQELTFGVARAKVNGTMTVVIGELATSVFFESLDVPIYFNWTMF